MVSSLWRWTASGRGGVISPSPESAAARTGRPLDVDLTWRALGKIDAYYSVYVKLLDDGGNAIARPDFPWNDLTDKDWDYVFY